MNASDVLDASARGRVESAIAAAEAKTSAEIVCAIATESGRYDRTESVVGLALAIVCLALVDVFGAGHAEDGWSSGRGMLLGAQAAAVVAGFVLGSWLASSWRPLRRLFVPAREMGEEVARAAAHVFGLSSVGMTSGQTGLLIYVTLLERRVVVLADRRTFEALGTPGVNALRDLALAKLAQGDVAGAFASAVQSAGERLQAQMPAGAAANPDELSNRVLVFPGRP